MKNILAFLLGFSIMAAVVVANATEINVAGQIIDIPSKHRAWKVERSANACVGKLMVDVQTEFAARQLPLLCVNMVLNHDDSWKDDRRHNYHHRR